jgi:hypothetical protein
VAISRSGGGFGPTATAPSGNGAISSAILFPSNGDGSVSNVRFALSGAAMPDIVPLTLLWKVYPVSQAGYCTTFFHGRTDGSFIGDTTYFGCHPYPDTPPNGTPKSWEISIEGGDDIVDENGNNTSVVNNAWYSQAASTRSSGTTIVDFYWDLRTSVNRRISHTTGSALTNAAQSPAVTFGDAPWSANNERLSGRLRGIQIYNAQLSEANIQALELMEDDAAVLAKCSALGITSLWYLNMNPTPSDITDKSGNGRNPSWVSADHGTLWTP